MCGEHGAECSKIEAGSRYRITCFIFFELQIQAIQALDDQNVL
jgi:hypothetical protein